MTAIERIRLCSQLMLVGCLSLCAFAQGAPAASLNDQLSAQYKLVKTGSDSYGLAVVDPGTVLTIQKGGLLGVSPKSAVLCPSKFQDGGLKGPSGLCAAMVKQNSRYLSVGEKVYPLKLEVSLDKDKVSVQVIECDSCNGATQPSFYKSELIIQFAKGTLKTLSVPQVEDTISQVLAFDQGGAAQ